MNGSNLVLASGSFIRKEIMTNAGLDFTVIVKPVDESSIKASMLAESAPIGDIADALAEAKAMRVSRTTPGLIVGADQIMEMDGRLFDKPETMGAARERLWSMRGKTHYLVGAVVVCEDGRAVWRYLSRTKLIVRNFSEAFLDDYLASEGESVLSSVGGYKFEGRGAQLFSHVEGDFFSILGLPLLPLLDYLRIRGAAQT